MLQLLLGALVAAPAAGFAQGVRPSLLDPETLVCHLADGDGNGAVDRGEWQLAVERLLPGEDDALTFSQSAGLIAELIEPLLDADGNGDFTREDLETVWARLDRDGNGLLERSEAGMLRGTGQVVEDGLLALLLLRATDRDGNGTVESAEYERLPAAIEEAGGRTVLEGWIRTIRTGPGERAAWSADVVLLDVLTALDSSSDGKIARADLAALFTTLDADKNGVLANAEWIAAAPAPERSQWNTVTPGLEGPLVPWQRTLEDALALSQATGRPLLICVNIDGELASDALARNQYRDPRFVELVRGFVPVLASPDRHTARDYDDRGRRIEDPRFGRLVCSEHIDIEPRLYETYFDGRRVAPRHVAIAPDGTKLFDLSLLESFEPLEAKLREHGRPDAPTPESAQPELDSFEALFASPAAAHRSELERRFEAADAETRAGLARAAYVSGRAAQQPELLRLALFDPEPSVRAAGMLAFAEHASAAPFELAGPALLAARRSAPEQGAELLAALERAGAGGNVQAERLATVQRGLELDSDFVDLARWHAALAWAPEAPASPVVAGELDAQLSELERLRAAAPDDTEIATAFAATMLALADAEAEAGRNPTMLYEDARAVAAEVATQVDVERDPRARALEAWGAYQVADFEGARAAVEEALPALTRWAETPLAARTLSILAALRLRDIYAAMGRQEAFPASWVADFDACHAVLREHPSGVAGDVVDWYDGLAALEARGAQHEVLAAALARFPDAGDLHDRVQWYAAWTGGAEALRRAYDDIQAPAGSEASFAWYDGFSKLLGAERAVENGARWTDFARESYTASVAAFERAIEREPSYADSALHYVALAHGGLAKLALGEKNLAEAATEATAALLTRPASAELADGLGDTPRDTARKVLRALDDAGLEGPVETLRAALEAGSPPATR